MLIFDERAVDRVAEVVAKPVGHRSQQVSVLPAGARTQLIEDPAYLIGDVDVPALALPANEVRLPIAAASHDGIDCLTVVCHVEPIANIQSGAVYRNRF